MKLFKSRYFCALIFGCYCYLGSIGNVFSQTNPGGVSESNLWLKANSGTTTSGSNLTGWTDQSGVNNFVMSGTPQFVSNQLNYNPIIKFNNSSGSGLPDNGLVGSTQITAVEVIGVFKYNSSLNQGTVLGSTTSSSAVFSSLLNGTIFGTDPLNSQTYPNSEFDKNFSINTVDLAPSIANAYINGLATNVVQNVGSDFTSISLNTPIIGGAGSTNWAKMQGDLAELIVYPNSLSVGDRSKIHSYLAVKYGITLDPSIGSYTNSAGSVIWDETAYWNDVFGIGKDDGSGLNQPTSNSNNTGSGDGTGQNGKGNIRLASPSSMDDGDFLMIGHDNGDLTEQLTDLPQDLIGYARLGREWKVKQTGNVGSFNFAYDLTGLSLTGSILGDFKLIIDEDGDGDFTTGQVQELTPTQ